MNWTKEQKETIDARGKSILVSAAAGSGKTAVLVERIKRLIIDEQLDLDELLIVTFTNAAASEMREKIVSAIPEQMNQIHKARISTFHSFALEVIRRYFHIIDIDPGFKICDDAQKVLLQNEAMTKLFSKKFEDKDSNFLDFLKLYGSSRSEETVKTMILGVYDFIQSHPDPFGWLAEKIEFLSVNESDFKASNVHVEIAANIDEALEMAVWDLTKVLELLKDNDIKSLIAKGSLDLEKVENIRETFISNFDEGRKKISEITYERFAPAKDDKESFDAIRENINFIRGRAKDTIKDIGQRYCEKTLGEYIEEINGTYPWGLCLFRLVRDFDVLYSDEKKKKNLVDFADIEQYALKILSEDEAAGEYRNKIKYIFIDEYQDSNMVQEAIIHRIQCGNNVFMVGDVKQSIYKFRLAEPEIFMERYQKYKDNQDPLGMKLDLNRNFRSKGPIINVVNHLFGNVMSKRRTGIEYDDAAALYKGVDYEGPLEHRVELHLIDDKKIESEDLDEEIKAMKKVELEALAAVEIIKESVGTPYYDSKTKEQKLLKNRDMVILLRSGARTADIYYQALEEEGIPAFMDTGDGYFDTLEVSVFINLLKIIDNKKQDVALLSVLRSPILNFSINELAQIRGQNRRCPFYEALLSYSVDGPDLLIKEKCKEAFEKINLWKKQAGFLALPEFLWSLIKDTGYYNYIGALPAGGQRQGNLRALADKASDYEASSGKGLFGFINYIEAVKDKKIPVPPVKLIGESDDVVRIMTVHKSKGLEYPMVLLGGLGRQFHRSGGKSINLHKDMGIGLRFVDENIRFYKQTLIQKIIEDRVLREDIAEEIRILYVALTRAKDKLIMLGTTKDAEKLIDKAQMQKGLQHIRGNNYLDFILFGLADYKEIDVFIHGREDIGMIQKEKRISKAEFLKELSDGFADTDEDVDRIVRNRLKWAYPFKKSQILKSKYSVSELNYGLRRPRPIIGEEKESGHALRGSAYHKVIEHIPLRAMEYNLDSVESFVNTLINRELMTAEEAGLLDLSKIVKLFESPLGKRLIKAEKVFRETAFNLVGKKDGEEIIIQGIIDCYFEEGDKIVLVDFKSDYTDGSQKSINRIIDRYKPQLESYKDALTRIKGVDVEEVYLYLFILDREIRL